jgi:hypothetical protein
MTGVGPHIDRRIPLFHPPLSTVFMYATAGSPKAVANETPVPPYHNSVNFMSLSALFAKMWAVKVFGQYGNVKVRCHIVPGPWPIKYKSPMFPDHSSVNFIALSELGAEISAIKVSEICHCWFVCYCLLAHGPGPNNPSNRLPLCPQTRAVFVSSLYLS